MKTSPSVFLVLLLAWVLTAGCASLPGGDMYSHCKTPLHDYDYYGFPTLTGSNPNNWDCPRMWHGYPNPGIPMQ